MAVIQYTYCYLHLHMLLTTINYAGVLVSVPIGLHASSVLNIVPEDHIYMFHLKIPLQNVPV